MDLETELRGHVYRITIERGAPPSIAELAATVSGSDEDVRRALAPLQAARILVLQPVSGEILMAPPFSAVPTPFLVESPRHAAYANCVWDAFGIPITLGEPAHLVSACGCCGEAIRSWRTPTRRPTVAASFISPFRPLSGGTTSCSLERRCCSSGMKSTSRRGAASGRWRAAQRCRCK